MFDLLHLLKVCIPKTDISKIGHLTSDSELKAHISLPRQNQTMMIVSLRQKRWQWT